MPTLRRCCSNETLGVSRGAPECCNLDLPPLNESWGRKYMSCKLLPFVVGQESQVFLALEQTSRAHISTQRDATGGAASVRSSQQAGEGSPAGCGCKNKVYKYKLQLHSLSSGRKLRQLLS